MKIIRSLRILLVGSLSWGVLASGHRANVAYAAPPITAISASPDGSTLVVGSQAGISVLSLPDLKPIQTLSTEIAHVHDLVHSTDGGQLIATGGQPAVEGTLEIWLMPEGRLDRRREIHDDVIYKVAVSSDANRLVTASADGTCNVLSMPGAETQHSFDGHSRSVFDVVFMPDNKALVSASADSTIRLWRPGDEGSLRTLSNHVAAVAQVAIAPHQSDIQKPIVIVSISEDRTLRVWQPMIGRLVRFTRFTTPPTAVVWLPDGERLVVSCRDGTLWMVNASDLEFKRLLAEDVGRVYELAYVQQHQSLIAAGDLGVRQIDLP